MNNERYLEYYKRGLINYIPNVFLPKYKPDAIDEIIKVDSSIGKIVGVNLKPVDFNNANDLQRYIKALSKFSVENYSRLYLEGQENLNKDVKRDICEGTNLKILDGKDTKIKNLPLVIENIYRYLKDSPEGKEVLVISRDKEIVKRVIREISSVVKLITIAGCTKDDNEEIYNYVFEEMGLSLFYPYNVEKIIGNYSIIINLMDDVDFDLSKARKNSIIFNFSNQDITNSNRLALIDDFGFSLKDMEIGQNKWLGSRVSTSLYQGLLESGEHDVKYLISKNQYYPIKDYVNSQLKVKGRL